MIAFEPPDEAELLVNAIDRTLDILDRLFPAPEVKMTDRGRSFEQAIDDLRKEGRTLLASIDAHPRHNENGPKMDDLTRFINAAREITRKAHTGVELHPNSTMLRALQRGRKVDEAAREHEDSIDAEIARNRLKDRLIVGEKLAAELERIVPSNEAMERAVAATEAALKEVPIQFDPGAIATELERSAGRSAQLEVAAANPSEPDADDAPWASADDEPEDDVAEQMRRLVPRYEPEE